MKHDIYVINILHTGIFSLIVKKYIVEHLKFKKIIEEKGPENKPSEGSIEKIQ